MSWDVFVAKWSTDLALPSDDLDNVETPLGTGQQVRATLQRVVPGMEFDARGNSTGAGPSVQLGDDDTPIVFLGLHFYGATEDDADIAYGSLKPSPHVP